MSAVATFSSTASRPEITPPKSAASPALATAAVDPSLAFAQCLPIRVACRTTSRSVRNHLTTTTTTESNMNTDIDPIRTGDRVPDRNANYLGLLKLSFIDFVLSGSFKNA